VVGYRELCMENRSDLPAIRVSDEEREHSIALLRDAVVTGRLTLEEFSERVGHAQLARTDRQLAELTVDLPAQAPVPAIVTQAKHRAICSKLVRRGSWEIPERSSWRSLFGTIVLDLREARLAGPVVELEIHNTFGTAPTRPRGRAARRRGHRAVRKSGDRTAVAATAARSAPVADPHQRAWRNTVRARTRSHVTADR
jgi:Domain of unknown function (DUF1707)